MGTSATSSSGPRAHLALLAWAALAGGCAPAAAPPEPPRAAPAEHPAVGTWTGAPLLHLRLEPDGRYEAYVLARVSAFGCGDVVGNGASRGRWRVEGARVLFEVEAEPEELVRSFRGGSAVRAGEGLVLELGGEAFALERGGG